MRKKILSFILVAVMAICFVGSQTTEVSAKARYITNRNFRGTFTIGGQECTFESGGYTVVIGNISSKGKIKLQLHRWSANAGKLSDTDVITTKIKRNKAVFRFKDSYDGSREKGIITFHRDKTIELQVKVIKKAEFSGYSMEIDKTTFERVSKEHKLEN